MAQQMQALARMLEQSHAIAFFGGAGVSTESGIPDFRSVDGLYHTQWEYPPEVMLSHTFFSTNPEAFFQFYREKLLYPDAQPNAAHLALAQLEAEGRLHAVVTQNIDGLHQRAGSKRVYEVHGSVYRNTCMACGHAYPGLDVILKSEGVPRCACRGVIKPDVVLYEEGLPQDVLRGAERAIQAADMLIIGGTSLAVYPASGLVEFFYGGDRLVVINKTPTPMDERANLVIRGPIGQVLSEACGLL